MNLIKHSTNPGTVYGREHWNARKVFGNKTNICSICGNNKRRTEIHHKNENWKDHRKENLIEICRGCHIKQHRIKPKCKVESCSLLSRRYGYCHNHSQRFKKWGNPLAVKKKNLPLIFIKDVVWIEKRKPIKKKI